MIQIGDRVRVRPDTTSGFTECEGTVVVVRDVYSSVRVLLDGHRTSLRFWENEIEAVQ